MDLILIWDTATVFFPIMRKIWESLIAPEKKKTQNVIVSSLFPS